MPALRYDTDYRICLMNEPAACPEEELATLHDAEPVEIEELGRYYLKCFDTCPDFLQYAPYVVQKFPGGLIELSFKNWVGLTRIGPFEVIIKNLKITEQQFQSMLDDITDKAANLVFSTSGLTGQDTQRVKPGNDTTYLEMLFLRRYLLHTKPDIEGIAQAILADPHRKFERIKHKRNLQEISEVRTGALMHMVHNPQDIFKLPHDHALNETSMARALKKASAKELYPSQLLQEEVQHSVDTPENRFVKHFLFLLLRKISGYLETTGQIRTGVMNQGLETDMEILEHKLLRFSQAGLWRDVCKMKIIPASSQVLQRREGYRSLFRLNALLSLTTQYSLTLPDFSRIIEINDTATLYEYWVFFIVKDILDDMIKPDSVHVFTIKAQDETVPPELILKYEGNVSLSFNRTFHSPGQSYSHDLRPDITLEHNNRLLIFDAKYKGKNTGFYGEEDDHGFIKTFQMDDVDKMHTYRDAIDNVEGAFALYPGLEKAVFHPPGADQIYQGVGAVPLKPGPSAQPEPEHEMNLREIIEAFLNN